MPVHESRFNIQTPQDFLRHLVIPQYQDFVGNNSSVRHALLTIILVYHMYEWVHRMGKKKGKKKSNFANRFRSDYPSEHDDLAQYFCLAKGITNDTKHFVSNVRTMTQTGFSQDFSHDFARPLNLELPDGRTVSVDIFLERLVEFWKRQESLGFKRES